MFHSDLPSGKCGNRFLLIENTTFWLSCHLPTTKYLVILVIGTLSMNLFYVKTGRY